ncbi:hypothetical protein [Rhodococcus sp. DMU1]|uniref:hypothetical protein n=1 Tax=Rhodococcus sp. DMU1 TaxID=2722825 RepID=UPI00143ECA42|nr:hypothetical protein [Rhodococcus sp. DMU1]QIX53999.1 hypothetical protein HFP48_31230 [Rhodococcus sp. DMU1]
MTVEQHRQQNDRLGALLESAQEVGAFDARGRLTPDCAELAQELYNNALPRLLSMLKDGRIVSAGPLGAVVYLDAEDLDFLAKSKDTRDELALEMISRAFRPFLAKVVDRRRWDSSQSSLSTFFVNRCLLTKGQVLGDWVEHRSNRQDERAAESEGFKAAGQSFDQEDEFLRHVVFQLIQGAPSDVRPILEIVSRGFDIRDAARAMEITENAARNRLYRWRKHIITPKLGRFGKEVLPRGYALVEYLLTDRRSAA